MKYFTGFYFLLFSLFRLLSSGSLVIISPTVDDTAVYECSVSNDAGEDQRAVELTVQGREDITVTGVWHLEFLWDIPMLGWNFCLFYYILKSLVFLRKIRSFFLEFITNENGLTTLIFIFSTPIYSRWSHRSLGNKAISSSNFLHCLRSSCSFSSLD